MASRFPNSWPPRNSPAPVFSQTRFGSFFSLPSMKSRSPSPSRSPIARACVFDAPYSNGVASKLARPSLSQTPVRLVVVVALDQVEVAVAVQIARRERTRVVGGAEAGRREHVARNEVDGGPVRDRADPAVRGSRPLGPDRSRSWWRARWSPPSCASPRARSHAPAPRTSTTSSAFRPGRRRGDCPNPSCVPDGTEDRGVVPVDRHGRVEAQRTWSPAPSTPSRSRSCRRATPSSTGPSAASVPDPEFPLEEEPPPQEMVSTASKLAQRRVRCMGRSRGGVGTSGPAVAPCY